MIATSHRAEHFRPETLKFKFITAGLRYNVLTREMKANTMTDRALASKAVIAEYTARMFATKSKHLAPRVISRKKPPKQIAFPRSLRPVDELYPFKLIPSPAEERPLETSTVPSHSLQLVEIWIATCPPETISCIIKYTLEVHLMLVSSDNI